MEWICVRVSSERVSSCANVAYRRMFAAMIRVWRTGGRFGRPRPMPLREGFSKGRGSPVSVAKIKHTVHA